MNKPVVQKPYPLPKISTVLQELECFWYATTLDLNMGYYTLQLDLQTSNVSTIIFPWGTLSYCRLPLVLADAPDVFEAKINSLFNDLGYVCTYVYDLLILFNSIFEDHLDKLSNVLQHL